MSDETQPGRYVRENSGLEFDRVSFFSDAIYAIAMTLLVVGLHMPDGAALRTPREMLAALSSLSPDIFGFFIGFAVLGRYWKEHHAFFARLGSIDQRLIFLNLIYLAIIAFSPFPVSLISDYEKNPASFMLFALCMAAISGLETVMFYEAARRGHFRRLLSPTAIRHGVILSGVPVLFMLASLPLGLIDPTIAFLSWLLMVPMGALLARLFPFQEGRLDPGAEP